VYILSTFMMVRRRISRCDIWTFEFISYYTVRRTLRRMTSDYLGTVSFMRIYKYIDFYIYFTLFFH